MREAANELDVVEAYTFDLTNASLLAVGDGRSREVECTCHAPRNLAQVTSNSSLGNHKRNVLRQSAPVSPSRPSRHQATVTSGKFEWTVP